MVKTTVYLVLTDADDVVFASADETRRDAVLSVLSNQGIPARRDVTRLDDFEMAAGLIEEEKDIRAEREAWNAGVRS